MISALGHCEDPACSQETSSRGLVRLFRCSIHCDRLLCLFHLNSHNVYYEEEKKQNAIVLDELQNSLTLYQRIFEQHMQTYRELVHQASSLLLQNTSTLIPIERIRPVLEQIQDAMAALQNENSKIIIKCESELNDKELESEIIDVSSSKQISMKNESMMSKKTSVENDATVVVRLKRVELNKTREADVGSDNQQADKKDQPLKQTKTSTNSTSTDSINDNDHRSHTEKSCRSTDENQRSSNKRSRVSSPNSSRKRQCDTKKNKN